MDSFTTLFLYWNQWELQLSPELQMLVLQRDWRLEDNADFDTETELWENPRFLPVLYVKSCSDTIFTVALIKKNEEKEVGLHRCWICPPGRVDCEECLAGEREVGCLPVRWERRHNAGLEMVIAPTPRTAGVETLECFEAGNVICATVWGESGSITFVELHRQVLTSEMCENVGSDLNAFIWYSYRLAFSLSFSSTQIHFTVAIDFTASNGKNFFSVDCFLFWVCSPCYWLAYLNQILP